MDAMKTAETWFINGQVLVYESGSILEKEAVGVKDDKIVFVGSTEEAKALMSPLAAVLDVQGSTIMPGIHDAHMHGRKRSVDGWVQSSCDLNYEGGTVEDVLAKLKEGLLAEGEIGYLKSDYLFVAINLFAPALLPAGTLLTRHDLDRLSKDPSEDEFGTGTSRPIVVYDKGIHSNFANTQAIINARVENLAPDPGHIGVDPEGRVNGVFNDFPGDWGEFPPMEGDEEYKQRLDDLREANSFGITSQFEAAGTLESAQVWAQICDEGMLTTRLNQSINVTEWARGNSSSESIQENIETINALRNKYRNYPSGKSPGSLTVDTVKIFADGEAEYPHQTAAMIAPYNDNVGSEDEPVWQASDRYGENPSASDALLSFLALDEEKWNIHVHCLGDRSTKESLDNFEKILEENPEWDRRHVICHLAFVLKEDVARMSKNAIIGNLSLQWARRDAWSVDAYEGYINKEILDRAYPTRELLDAGVTLSGGSDWPVDPLNPWLQMQISVTREGIASPKKGIYPGKFAGDQSISVEETLIMHTLGGAIQMHQDDVTGSIEVGKFADLVILGENPLQIAADELANIPIKATIVGGQLVYGELPEPNRMISN